MDNEEQWFKGEKESIPSWKILFKCWKLDEIKQMGSKLQGADFDLRDHEIFREILKEIILKHCSYLVEMNEPHYPHIILKCN